jgi:hypothetical protein
VGVCSALLGETVAFATTTKQDALSMLSSALDADELTHAAVVRQIGDDTLLAALHQVEDAALRLAAIRCTPYLSDPDRALDDLSAIAGGRDPDHAPAAAARVFQIAQTLVRRGATQEVLLDSWGVSRARLAQLADDRSALEPIRLLAGQAGFLLDVIVQRQQQGEPD